jgi:hypothetical protein
MTFLAYTPTPEFWALLSLIVGGLIKFGYQLRKDKLELRLKEQARQDAITEREQTRLDLAAVAGLTVEQLKVLDGRLTTVDENGKNRLKVLLNSNVTTRAYAKKAIDTGNHVTEKFNSLLQSQLDSKDIPQKVEVVNPESDPVHVNQTP